MRFIKSQEKSEHEPMKRKIYFLRSVAEVALPNILISNF